MDMWFCGDCRDHSVYAVRCSSKQRQSVDSPKCANERVKRVRRTKTRSILEVEAMSSLSILFGDLREFASTLVKAKHRPESETCKVCLRDLVFAVFERNGETFCRIHTTWTTELDLSTRLTKADVSLLRQISKIDERSSFTGLLEHQAGYYLVSGMFCGYLHVKLP